MAATLETMQYLNMRVVIKDNTITLAITTMCFDYW
jgi:hypothetical protein